MDTKARIRSIALVLVLGLAAVAGIALFLGGTRHRGTPAASDIIDQRTHDLEQGLAGKDREISGTLEDARSSARDLNLGIGGIGENANRSREYLEDLGRILEELRRRSEH